MDGMKITVHCRFLDSGQWTVGIQINLVFCCRRVKVNSTLLNGFSDFE